MVNLFPSCAETPLPLLTQWMRVRPCSAISVIQCSLLYLLKESLHWHSMGGCDNPSTWPLGFLVLCSEWRVISGMNCSSAPIRSPNPVVSLSLHFGGVAFCLANQMTACTYLSRGVGELQSCLQRKQEE